VRGKVASLIAAACLIGCARAPSPLAPHFRGSIGMPHRGVLSGESAELPKHGDGYRWLRGDDRHHAVPRLVAAIERGAAHVAQERPGATLAVGDLSFKTGGKISGHASHRSGRDVDLLLYFTTLEGVPVESPGFGVHVGNDGLAWDEDGNRFLRFDVEREWLLVKSLVEDDAARIQWIFASRAVKNLLIEWGRARSDTPETILRALDVLLQPAPPAEAHDDHVHVRTACSPEEIGEGCEPTGPARPWIVAHDGANAKTEPAATDAELALSLLRPLQTASIHATAKR
jgi:penicillin-insensitive murein endopeptidase